MSLSSLLDSFDLGEQFVVEQEDTMTLRCTSCGETVSADVVDLHDCEGSR